MEISREEYLGAIAEGVRQAIVDCMPSESDILEAIQKGVSDSFPWPSEIDGSIYNATYRATMDKEKT